MFFRRLTSAFLLVVPGLCLGADEPATERRTLALQADQFYSVTLQPHGAEYVATLFAPDGKQIARGTRRVLILASTAGEYRLEIAPLGKDAPAGSYTLQFEGPRSATAQDRKRIDAFLRYQQAAALERSATPEQRRQAIAEYEAAVQLWREGADTEGEANTYVAIARNYLALREPAKTIEFDQKALLLELSARNLRGQLDALRGLALAADRLGDNPASIDYQLRALPLARELGARFEEGILRNNLGHAYWAIGEEPKALDLLNQALAIRKEIRDQLGIAYTLQELGNVHSALGDAQEALNCYQESLPLWRAEKQKQGEAYALNNIGLLYASLGDLNRALPEYDAALAIWRELKFQPGEGRTLNNVGMAHAALHQTARALEEFGRALAIFEGLNDRAAAAYPLQNIGDAYAELGDAGKALEYYERSLAWKRAAGDRTGEAYTLHNMGDVYATQGDPAAAEKRYREALALRQSSGDRAGEALTRAALARIERDQGQLEEARAGIETALAQIESLRTSLNNPGLRVSYFASRRSYYDFYIDLLMRMNQPALALQASERARARSLLDTLGELRVDIRQGVDRGLLEREQDLTRAVNAEAQRLSQYESSPNAARGIAASRKRLQDLIARHEEAEAAIRAASPHYASLTQPEPLSPDQIRRQVLDNDTLLLEFSLGQDKSYGWALSATSLRGFALPPGDEIEKLARRAYEALVGRNREVENESLGARRARLDRLEMDFRRAAARLSNLLLAPAAGELHRARRLLIVCGGALQSVPFAALAEPGSRQPLIARHEIVNLPSASVLAVLRREMDGRPKPSGALAVLADPVYESNDPRVRAAAAAMASGARPFRLRGAAESGAFPRLRFSRREADQITALAAGRKNLEAVDFEANPALVRSGRLADYAYVHFATHAVVDSEHPELSGIVLSLVDPRGRAQDGYLRMLEIYNLKLDASLVTLSACRTALGKNIRGEGLIGLTRGFFYAGAARVAASLWSVDDRVTAELMRRFYSGILQAGLSPAAALRAAQLAMWHDKQWRSPYYWAGFTLQGEWK